MGVFFNNYFSSIEQYDEKQIKWFNEGPVEKKKIIGVNTSSISTAGFDIYRQGVEISQNKHIIGNFKILAGTPGHIVQPLSFGVENIDIISENYCKDFDYFNPVYYLQVQENTDLIEKVFTFPIITPGANQSENYSFNGIIEPLTIRPIASFFSIEFPFESHTTRGSMMAGNTDQAYGSSDLVLTVDYRPDRLSTEGRYINDDYFLDAFESMDPNGSGIPIGTGYFDTKLNTLASFNDDRVHADDSGAAVIISDEDILSKIKSMKPNEENYISVRKKSAFAGFVYDTPAGTDSITFGGMQHQ